MYIGIHQLISIFAAALYITTARPVVAVTLHDFVYINFSILLCNLKIASDAKSKCVWKYAILRIVEKNYMKKFVEILPVLLVTFTADTTW